MNIFLKILIALVLVALGIGWYLLMEWFRGRPRFMEQGTQHILLIGYMGFFIGIFAAILALIS